jgi:hypothetical protein
VCFLVRSKKMSFLNHDPQGVTPPKGPANYVHYASAESLYGMNQNDITNPNTGRPITKLAVQEPATREWTFGTTPSSTWSYAPKPREQWTQDQTPMTPYDGRGLYSAYSQPLHDDCFLDPMQAHYSSQGGCAKIYSSGQVFGEQNPQLISPTQNRDPIPQGQSAHYSSWADMRQNGNRDLPGHFSRFGYNDRSGTCANGYCLANHNGRYICGSDQIGKGIFADPIGLAPQSWYDKKQRQQAKTYWAPYSPRPPLPGY